VEFKESSEERMHRVSNVGAPSPRSALLSSLFGVVVVIAAAVGVVVFLAFFWEES